MYISRDKKIALAKSIYYKQGINNYNLEIFREGEVNADSQHND